MLNTNSPKRIVPFFDFYCYRNTGFLETLSSLNSWLLTADKSIVNLNLAGQLFSACSDHRPSKFVKPGPNRLGTLQTQDTLQTCSANSGLLSTYPPHGSKPHPKWLLGSLQDGSGSQRSLMVAVGTFYKIPLIGPSMVMPTNRTTKTVRPPLNKKIISARFLSTEPCVELYQILWKIW